MARPRLDTPTFRLADRGGTFYVKWWADGGWKRVSTRSTDRREAERFLAQFTAGALTPAPPPQPTISEILDGYLADRKDRVASYDTLRHACAAVRRHLGDMTPETLSTARARLYVRQRRREGYEVGPPDARRRKPVSSATATREIVTLRAALRWAIAAKWITKEQEPVLEAPGGAPPRERWLSRDEADRLLASCVVPHVKLFCAVALYTAARSGAILDLTWNRVDFAADVIDFGAGAGNKRRSVVPIPDALRPALAEAYAGRTTAWVIEFAASPVASVKTGFIAACRRAGLSGVTPHILRHTAATWMAMGGVPMAQVALYLGNSVEVTERVYAKYSPEYLRGAAAVLSGGFRGQHDVCREIRNPVMR